MANGDYNQFITLCFSFPSSSPCSPAPAWGLSHRIHFFRDCSNKGTFHGVQSFRHKLLQCGYAMGHSSCQDTASAWALHRLQLPSGHVHLLWCGFFHGLQVDICSAVDFHRLQGDNLLHHSLHHELQGNLVSSATSLLIFSTSFTQVVQGDGEWGLWLVHHILSVLLLLPWGKIPPTLPLFQ